MWDFDSLFLLIISFILKEMSMEKDKKRKTNIQCDPKVSLRFIFKEYLSKEDEEHFWNKLFDLFLEGSNIEAGSQRKYDLPK